MRMTTRSLVVVLAIALTGLIAGCSSGPSVHTAESVATPTPEPTPTPVPEQVVTQPENEPVPSVEVAEELPEDLQELNRRGYLKDVFFDTDSYEIRPDARDTLAADAVWLKKYPSVRILIEGHCDERNTREYNLALGERRANAVRDYLIALGIAPDRIQTISYGEERPFALGHDEAAWRLNRRAHFVIIGR